MKSLKLIYLFMAVIWSGGTVQAQSGVCRLTTFWVDRDPFSSSSRHLVGEFPLVLEDEPILKLMRHADSGVNVSIGIKFYKGIFKGEPTRIRLAIGFQDKPEDIFDDLDRSEGESVYDKNWRWLSVSKSLEIEKRVYTFTIGCERTNRKKRSLAAPPKKALQPAAR
jgi:hypothetical protein